MVLQYICWWGMKKTYIKLNCDDEHLSLGNLFRIIKDLSKNKTKALQTDLFCLLFDIYDINDTTVNNYCVGIRSIGDKYKQIFIDKRKKYEKDHRVFMEMLLNVLSIIDGKNYIVKNQLEFINTNDKLNTLARKLYNISKNDKQVTNDFSEQLSIYLNNGDIYECLVEEISFIIIEKKQPLIESELKRGVLENILNDTSISASDLESYLSLKLREGINYDYSMKELASTGNAYANFELGSNEYYGYVKGYPRYDEAYKYLLIAANQNHPTANYILAIMYLNGLINNKTKEDLKDGYRYLEKAYNLGNIASINYMGIMYLKGMYPLKKDINKAKELFIKASASNYAYAFNNLGMMLEIDTNLFDALSYYLKAATLGESWACNKVAEYYRKTGNKVKAFDFYQKAIESNYQNTCYYAYYNLAKYYYQNGYNNIKKDKEKYLSYLNIASDNNIIEASIELFLYYYESFLRKGTHKDDVYKYKKDIENNPKYSKDIKELVTNSLNRIKEKESNEIELLL